MPILEIDGIGKVQVGDEFKSMSPADQEAFVGSIVDAHAKGIRSSLGGVEKPSIAGDIVKSAGAGVLQGAIETAGAPKSILNLARDYAILGAGKLGASQDLQGRLKTAIDAANKLTPFGWGPSSDQLQKDAREKIGAPYEPQTTAGHYAHSVGTFVPGALTMGAGSLPAIANNVARYAVAPGLLSEVAGQATKGTAAEPYARAGAGLLGAVVGAAIPTQTQAGKAASRAFDYLESGMKSDGLTPALVAEKMRALGPDAIPADVSLGLRGAVETAMTRPGESQNAARGILDARHAGRNTRLQGDVTSALGPYTPPIQATEALRAQHKSIGADLPAIFESAPPVDTSNVLAAIGEKIGKARGPEQSALAQARGYIMKDTPLGPAPITDLETLHNTKQVLQNLAKYGDPTLGVAPGSLAKADGTVKHVTGLLNEALYQNPAYAENMQKLAALNQRMQAIEAGTKALRAGDKQMAPTVFAQKFAANPATQGDVRLGIRGDIERVMGQQNNDMLALRNAVKGSGDWNQQILTTAFGNKPTNQLSKALDREAAYATTRNDVAGNSATARRAQGNEALRQAAGAFPVADDVGFWKSLGVARPDKALGSIANKMMANGIEKRSNQIAGEAARVGTMNGDEFAAYARLQLARQVAARKAANARILGLLQSLRPALGEPGRR